jgi:hypothetical protein
MPCTVNLLISWGQDAGPITLATWEAEIRRIEV